MCPGKMIYLWTLLLLFPGHLFLVHGKPTEEQAEAGPCIGMDCLHGVLMHNDEDIGEKHTAEDRYIQLKEELETGSEKKMGPCEGLDCLHEAMHAGEEPGSESHHGGPIGPEKVDDSRPAPEDPEQYFHGVLMHGDDAAGSDHEHEQVGGDVVHMEMPKNPQDFEDYMHGVMMHNDAEPGIRHHDYPHEDEQEETVGKMKPLSGDDLMHGVMMHDDEEGGHEHEKTTDDEPNKMKPLSGDDLMHGVLMHDDENAHGEHGSESIEEGYENHPRNVKIGPDPDDLHGILMHGDEEHGVDHTDEDKQLSEEDEDSGGVASVTDPESVIHPEGYENLDPKDIDLTKINSKDKSDYQEWKTKEKKTSEEEKEDLEWDWKQTLGYITDGFLSDIELMKRRYLSKFYSIHVHEEPSPDEKLEAQWLKNKGSNSDMRHELNLIGDTGPIGEAMHEHGLENEK